MTSILAWHFSRSHLRYDADHIKVITGLVVKRNPQQIQLCVYGPHASARALDALWHAPYQVNLVSRVEMSGKIIHGSDKLVAEVRTHQWVAECTETLRAFARWCALEVAHLWDCPDIVRRYLETGDESIRDAAYTAAYTAAQAAARDTALDTALDTVRDAAWAATWAATRCSALNTARNAVQAAVLNAAQATAQAAAWDAAWAVFIRRANQQFKVMLLELAPNGGKA